MSQETSREKKRRSPERQTPCTACPGRLPGSPPPGTRRREQIPHLGVPSTPTRALHPPRSIRRAPGPGWDRAFIWDVSGHEEFPAPPGEIPELRGRAQVMPTPPSSPGSPGRGFEPPLSGIQRLRLRKKKKKQNTKNKTKKPPRAENKTKPAITPDGRGIGFWLPLWFPPPPPACCGLNAAGFVWLIGSVNQVSVRGSGGSCPGEGS